MTAPVFVNSYSILIRNGLLARAKIVPPFNTCARYGRSIAKVIKPEHVLYLGIYFVKESMDSDGDSNHAEPRFLHKLRLGFSYLIQNNDPDEAEDIIDAGHWSLMKLLHDPAWHTFPNGVRIESVNSGERTHHYGNISGNGPNETPVAEMRMELEFRYRSYFEPIITDVFETMHVKSSYPWPEDPARQPVISEWIIKTQPEE